MKFVIYSAAVAIVAMTLSGNIALAEGSIHPYGGTTKDPSATEAGTAQAAASSPIARANTFAAAQYATGGISLRNRGAGGISVSGVVTPVKAAYLYWAVVGNGALPPAAASIQIQREFPLPASAAITLKGTVVGSGATPCWGGGPIVVYKARVPGAVATGNGLYKVALLAGASGSTAGGDPWNLPLAFPLWEGASMVIVGTGNATVVIYDKGLSGTTFFGIPGVTYTLSVPGTSYVRFDNIGADGQIGKSGTPIPGLAGENTKINGVLIAGPASLANTSDWDGNSGSPLPQLWDDTGHDITGVRFRANTVVNILEPRNTGFHDCLTPVANVLSVH